MIYEPRSRPARWLLGPCDAVRLRAFEVCFTGAFLVYMARQFMEAGEWLTPEGFHQIAADTHPLDPKPWPLLNVWALPFFGMVIFGSGVCVIAGRWKRAALGVTLLCSVYVQLADLASAFALNKIYIAGFAILFTAPPARDGVVSIAPVRILQATLVMMYFLTGLAKVTHNGQWLQSGDILWRDAQGIYRTELAAWLLRLLPVGAWTVMQQGSLIFELGAPIWFCVPRLRPLALGAGLLFHGLIAVLMWTVWVFSLQMVTFYVLFLSPEVLGRLRACVVRTVSGKNAL